MMRQNMHCLSNKKKLLYFVAEDWYFWSHRRLLALAAENKGYDVFVLTRVNKHGDKIKQLGFNLIPIEMERHGKNIFRELVILKTVVEVYKSVQPDIVHHIAIKPILYGTLATIFSKTKHVVNTFPGLGYVFESMKIRDRVIRFFLVNIFKILFKIKFVKIIVQNIDNANFLINEGVRDKDNISIIKGSGVDLTEYTPTSINNTAPIILFASRLLWQKGVADFVTAASIVRENNNVVRFVIVGEPDTNNPNSVPVATLYEWNDKGIVEWWGFKNEMSTIISQSKIVVLPTYYGEGIPKVLIEAAASAKPIITTDMPGCREIVIHEVNGFLIPARDPDAIAMHINQLLVDDELCMNMGIEGRKLVESEFSIDKVNAETLQIYDDLIELT